MDNFVVVFLNAATSLMVELALGDEEGSIEKRSLLNGREARGLQPKDFAKVALP